MQAGAGADAARTIRVRAYKDGGAHDLRRAYRVRADAAIAAVLKRAALAALPKAEGWHVLVVSAERTRAGEPVAAVLDRLARRLMRGGAGRRRRGHLHRRPRTSGRYETEPACRILGRPRPPSRTAAR